MDEKSVKDNELIDIYKNLDEFIKYLEKNKK